MPPALPASMPTVSTPNPVIVRSVASQRAPAADGPGVCGPFSSALRKAASSVARVLQPLRSRTHAPSGHSAVISFPGQQMVRLEEEVVVVGHLLRHVDHRRRTDQPVQADPVDGRSVPARCPVRRSIQVRARVLTGMDVVPTPHRARVVEVADRLQAEVDGVGERGRQPQHWSRRRQRCRQINRLDRPGTEPGQQRWEHAP